MVVAALIKLRIFDNFVKFKLFFQVGVYIKVTFIKTAIRFIVFVSFAVFIKGIVILANLLKLTLILYNNAVAVIN